MATILDKDLTRETTVKVDDREILITITEDQKISMKLKGMKSGAVNIDISELYTQLTGGPSEPKSLSIIRTEKVNKNDPMISLTDLRHRLNVKGFDYNMTVKFDSVLNELIEEKKIV